MAERTGDSKIDALIERFLTHTIGEGQVAVAEYAHPGQAAWACDDLSAAFRSFLAGSNVQAGIVSMGTEPQATFASMGYADAPDMSPGMSHSVVQIVQDEQIYTIDWTAAQYCYQEFPMIQRLGIDADGEEIWERDFLAPKLEDVTASGRLDAAQISVDPRIDHG